MDASPQRVKAVEQQTSEQRLTLRKAEKLRHRSLVEGLFRQGKNIYEFPLRAIWRFIDQKELADNFRDHIPERIEPLQMMITVPKKKRKKAVDRVLIRRRVREAYRLNRRGLKKKMEEHPNRGTLSVAFIYISDTNLPYATIEKKMKIILDRLAKKMTCKDQLSEEGNDGE